METKRHRPDAGRETNGVGIVPGSESEESVIGRMPEEKQQSAYGRNRWKVMTEREVT
jgi:hypothetical protein